MHFSKLQGYVTGNVMLSVGSTDLREEVRQRGSKVHKSVTELGLLGHIPGASPGVRVCRQASGGLGLI